MQMGAASVDITSDNEDVAAAAYADGAASVDITSAQAVAGWGYGYGGWCCFSRYYIR